MDHRDDRRNRIPFNVVIHSTGNRLFSGKARDISAGGMYVETPPAVEIDGETEVRVGFMVNSEMKIARARVAHRGDDGFGFKFTEHSAPEMQDALRDLVRSQERAHRTARRAV